jgi:hypothetical protein
MIARPLTTIGLAVALLPAFLPAQQRTVTGRVLTADEVPLAVTPVLLRDAATGVTVAQALSDMGGAFRFVAPAGRYRVVARRVGFRPDSLGVDVTDRDVAPVALHLAPIAVTLAQVTVAGDAACSSEMDGPLGAETLVWDEVAKGIESRLLLNRTFRYVLDVHREQVTERRIGDDQSRRTDTVVVNDPVAMDAAASRAAREGYTSRNGNTLNVRLFQDGDLLAPAFLKRHCRGTPYRDASDASVRIAFQPRAGAGRDDDGDAVLVRGVAVLDGVTWRTRRVEYQYVQDGDAIGGGALAYEDRGIEGASVAMLARASGTFRPPGVMPRLNGVRVRWDFTFGAPREVQRVEGAR